MSSTASDPTRKILLDVVTNSISQLQRKQLLNKDRLQSIRRFICQSIGLTILLYFIFRIPFLFYALLKVLLQSFVYLLTIIFWPYVKLLEFFLPKTTNYGILFLLFLVVSILSFLTAKLSSRKGYKNSPFLVVFIVLIISQSIFVLRPIALSIEEQRKLPLNPSINKEAIIRLSVKTNEHTSTVDQNKSIQMSSSRITTDFDVNGKHSNSIREHKTQPRLADETLSVDVLSEILPAKEREISSSQQLNRSPQIATKRFNQQIKRSGDKLNQWFDEVWHIHKFSNSQWKPHMSHIPQHHVSSFYTAYTDLRCTEHTQLIARQSLSKHKHFDVLDAYRSQSPFPIYLSILNSNGPKCYRYYSESFCANSPNVSSISLTKSTQLSMFISIVSIIFVLITQYRQHINKNKSCTHQPVVSNHVKNPANNEFIEKIGKELHQWLERERSIGCRNMSEMYRRTLNDRCLTKYDHLQVESLQFSNVSLSNICQTCNSSSVVNATLTIHSSVFTLLNSIRHEQYLVEIRRLVGDLEISLINEIQLRFTAKQIGSVELIDSTNVSTADGKQTILKLLTELINQTTVQFAFQQDKISNQLPDTRPITTTVQPVELSVAPPVPSIIDNHQQIILPKAKIKQLRIRIVKAVKLHDVEQPFCVVELNHPKQVHQTTIAKNGLNPFWDETFVFDCDDKSNEIHLKIFDRKKPNKKLNADITDKLYTDVSIPFSYVTSTIYKEDIRITPQYPESIIRIEFSTLSEEDSARVNNGSDLESNIDSQSWSSYRREASRFEQNRQQTPSTDVSPSDPPLGNNFYNYTSSLSRTTTTDIFPTPPDENSPVPKPRKSRSFMNSLRSFASFRQKKNLDKGKPKKNGIISSPNSTTGTNTLPHSFSADPYLYSHATGGESFRRHNTITRSFRNMFRSSSRKLPLQADNFILDHPDLLSTSPTSQKKPSFFQRFRSKHKTRRLNSLANSLTSYDRTRAESVQNTPVRANGTRPVTIPK